MYLENDTTNHQMNFLYGCSLYAMEQYEGVRDVLQKCYQKGDSSLAEEQAYVEMATEQGKNTIVIVEMEEEVPVGEKTEGDTIAMSAD